jgi:hypothetical protein
MKKVMLIVAVVFLFVSPGYSEENCDYYASHSFEVNDYINQCLSDYQIYVPERGYKVRHEKVFEDMTPCEKKEFSEAYDIHRNYGDTRKIRAHIARTFWKIIDNHK